jgi:glycosyltransferase involved in cell wall biosynthesis
MYDHARGAREAERIRALCKECRPDILHAHNLWFCSSPSVHRVAHEQGVATVQHLHNYRSVCVGAFLLRKGTTCEDCLRGCRVWPGVYHRCYRKSHVLSWLIARMIRMHRRRGTWERDVDLFVTPSECARTKFIEAGWPADRIAVKPNFVFDRWSRTPVERVGGVFVGRLSPEKGVLTLLKAWEHLHPLPLTIVGAGPQEEEIRRYLQQRGLQGVVLTGQLSAQACLDIVARSAVLIMPSEWHETFGRVIVEAYSVACPVLASRLGAMAELIQDGRTGYVFNPGDAEDLTRKIRQLLGDEGRRSEMGRRAREAYERSYTPSASHQRMMALYEEALARYARRSLMGARMRA